MGRTTLHVGSDHREGGERRACLRKGGGRWAALLVAQAELPEGGERVAGRVGVRQLQAGEGVRPVQLEAVALDELEVPDARRKGDSQVVRVFEGQGGEVEERGEVGGGVGQACEVEPEDRRAEEERLVERLQVRRGERRGEGDGRGCAAVKRQG